MASFGRAGAHGGSIPPAAFMATQSQAADPKFVAEDIDDLRTLLKRAANFCGDGCASPIVAAEIRTGLDVVDELAAELEGEQR